MHIPTLRETPRQPHVDMGAMWQLLHRTRPTLQLVTIFCQPANPAPSPRTITALRKKHNLSSPQKAPAIVSIWTEHGPEILKSTAYGEEEQWTPQLRGTSGRQADQGQRPSYQCHRRPIIHSAPGLCKPSCRLLLLHNAPKQDATRPCRFPVSASKRGVRRQGIHASYG